MPADEDAHAKLLREFGAAISGMELADLRQLGGDPSLVGRGVPRREPRPELRRPPRDEVVTYRIRADLDHATPPIWRRLDLRSDLPLDVVHQVLQVAFDWTDSHLHRFSVGGHPFDLTSQLFLCPYDVEEGEDDGVPARDVRLDETLQEPGDVLRYVYDYGDSWELTLRLEKVQPARTDTPTARAVDGRRAAPPEDSGGGTDLASLARVVDDPAHFDVDELNQSLRAPYFMLRELGVDPRLVDLLDRLRYTRIGEDLARRVVALAMQPTDPEPAEVSSALRAYRWFLDRAEGEGIELTSAGYLKPADVEAASAVVPAVGDWIGKNNREIHTLPLLDFRESLQRMGLLRKYKGTLRLTRAGAAAQRNPDVLWAHLAERLVSGETREYQVAATLLLLAYAATSPGAAIPGDQVTAALSELGWRHRDGRPLAGYEIFHLDAWTVLRNVSHRPADSRQPERVSHAAAALALAALRSSPAGVSPTP